MSSASLMPRRRGLRGTSPRDERFTARIPHADKAILQRAADHLGLSLSAYVFSKARTAAIADLADAGEVVLTSADQRTFVELLLNPPKPTTALRRALKAAHRTHRG